MSAQPAISSFVGVSTNGCFGSIAITVGGCKLHSTERAIRAALAEPDAE